MSQKSAYLVYSWKPAELNAAYKTQAFEVPLAQVYHPEVERQARDYIRSNIFGGSENNLSLPLMHVFGVRFPAAPPKSDYPIVRLGFGPEEEKPPEIIKGDFGTMVWLHNKKQEPNVQKLSLADVVERVSAFPADIRNASKIRAIGPDAVWESISAYILFDGKSSPL